MFFRFSMPMNSVINLSWNYKKLVKVSIRRWKEYMDKNKNKGITFPEVVDGDVIGQHFKEQVLLVNRLAVPASLRVIQ